MPSVVDTPEAEAARLLAQDPCVERVLLFGSRACGDAFSSADIDLAVDAPRASAVTRFKWREALDERRSLLRVDLVWLQGAEPEWRDTIERTGLVLFERDT